jgi:hypothetical protein
MVSTGGFVAVADNGVASTVPSFVGAPVTISGAGGGGLEATSRDDCGVMGNVLKVC